MSPRKAIPDDESDDLIEKREHQRMEKEGLRRYLGKPEPSALAKTVRWELWLHRGLNGLTQQQLGDLLDMKQPQIARLESGFVEPSLETLRKISERLGIDFTIEVRSGTMQVTVARPESGRATPRRGSRLV
jgi:ribosome-binding protein aMBF1 (putative translation factor)